MNIIKASRLAKIAIEESNAEKWVPKIIIFGNLKKYKVDKRKKEIVFLRDYIKDIKEDDFRKDLSSIMSTILSSKKDTPARDIVKQKPAGKQKTTKKKSVVKAKTTVKKKTKRKIL